MHRTEGEDYKLESGKRRYAPAIPPVQKATRLPAEDMNAIQEELLNVIHAAQLDEDLNTAEDRTMGWHQLLDSILQGKLFAHGSRVFYVNEAAAPITFNTDTTDVCHHLVLVLSNDRVSDVVVSSALPENATITIITKSLYADSSANELPIHSGNKYGRVLFTAYGATIVKAFQGAVMYCYIAPGGTFVDIGAYTLQLGTTGHQFIENLRGSKLIELVRESGVPPAITYDLTGRLRFTAQGQLVFDQGRDIGNTPLGVLGITNTIAHIQEFWQLVALGIGNITNTSMQWAHLTGVSGTMMLSWQIPKRLRGAFFSLNVLFENALSLNSTLDILIRIKLFDSLLVEIYTEDFTWTTTALFTAVKSLHIEVWFPVNLFMEAGNFLQIERVGFTRVAGTNDLGTSMVKVSVNCFNEKIG